MLALSGTLTSGELVMPPGYWAGSANDINDNDVVVGYARDSTAFRAARGSGRRRGQPGR